METIIKKTTPQTIKQQVDDIIVDISWSELSERYFGKSPSWLSRKMNGKGFNGNAPGNFTEAEKEQLRGALCDLADRIRRVAQEIH